LRVSVAWTATVKPPRMGLWRPGKKVPSATSNLLKIRGNLIMLFSNQNITLAGDIMKSGYESIVWIKDKNGNEYACYLDDFKEKIGSIKDLTEDEKAQCLDVNQLVGTERW